ncbi:hypothetical protein D6821_02005 [Candidatus Parcubacteria bacterium]|nr:MAG: hypothetical protein D6821_02005 [Candidatus Parcubacteria bacterium]
MRFNLSQDLKGKNIKGRWIVNLFLVGFLTFLFFGLVFVDEENNFQFSWKAVFFLVVLYFVVVYIFLRRQKAFSDFEVRDDGIVANGKIYPWQKLKRYHFLGESQSERFGTVRPYDPVNPFKGMNTVVVKIRTRHFFIHRWLGLEVASGRAKELISLLEKHGVHHTSRLKLDIGLS